MRWALVIAVCNLAPLAVGPPAHAQTETKILADGRNPFTLLKPHPLNRQLFEQHGSAAQQFRLWEGSEPLAWMADASIGSQQVLSASSQTRFHGFYIVDTYAAYRALDGLDLNLNLSLFNPSASDGYRLSSSVSAGAALHFYFDVPLTNRTTARADLLGTDLGPVTLGQGLLLEDTPLEGMLLQFSWDDFYFRHVFGGRVFWDDDDLFAFHLGALDGLVELQSTIWTFDDQAASVYVGGSAALPVYGPAPTVSANLKQRALLPTSIGAGIEYLARLRDESSVTVAHAGLAKLDLQTTLADCLALHLGYQSRYYQQGAGPRDRLEGITTLRPLPDSEDTYVTQSFEYFAASPIFDQWSHSVMAEAQLALGDQWGLRAETEYIRHYGSDPDSPTRFAALPSGAEFPGVFERFFYRGSLVFWPFLGLPHRLSLNFTNKQAQSDFFLTSNPTESRFETGHWVLFLGEAFL